MSDLMEMKPGDLLLVKTHHFVSRLIRFGQRGYGEPYESFNHVAVYVGDGEIVEALTGGVVLSPADKYPVGDTRVAVVLAHGASPGVPMEKETQSWLDMWANAVEFARSCVGDEYGWTTILCIALKVLFRGKLNFGVQGTAICSGLAARSLERLGYNFSPFDPAELTPAYLARMFTV